MCILGLSILYCSKEEDEHVVRASEVLGPVLPALPSEPPCEELTGNGQSQKPLRTTQPEPAYGQWLRCTLMFEKLGTRSCRGGLSASPVREDDKHPLAFQRG